MLGGVANWGWTVVGKKEAAASAPSVAASVVPVTVMGVRKKRKDGDAPAAGEVNEAQTLDAGLVRKKTKIEPTPVATAESMNGMQVLGAGLVRKKPKP